MDLLNGTLVLAASNTINCNFSHQTFHIVIQIMYQEAEIMILALLFYHMLLFLQVNIYFSQKIFVKSVYFSADISPISLPPLMKSHDSNSDVDHHPFENEEGLITGFGEQSSPGTRSPMLRQGFVRIIDDKKCKAFFNLTTPNHFCAQNTINHSNICTSDIGGSLTIQIERREILVGISSLILQYCSDAEPSAYTRISVYREWIRNVTSV